jgi:hypothetical protein
MMTTNMHLILIRGLASSFYVNFQGVGSQNTPATIAAKMARAMVMPIWILLLDQ